MAQVDGATSALKTGSNSERLKGVLFEFNLLFKTLIACLKNKSVKCVNISLSWHFVDISSDEFRNVSDSILKWHEFEESCKSSLRKLKIER